MYFVQDCQSTLLNTRRWKFSLFEPDPSLAMRKGNETDYMAAIKTSLGSSWTEVERLPPSDKPVVMVADVMALIQRHQHLGSSIFRQLEAKYPKQLLTSIPQSRQL